MQVILFAKADGTLGVAAIMRINAAHALLLAVEHGIIHASPYQARTWTLIVNRVPLEEEVVIKAGSIISPAILLPIFTSRSDHVCADAALVVPMAACKISHMGVSA